MTALQRGMVMGFHDNLKMVISYLKQFPNPTLVQQYTKLATTCRELKDSVDKLEQENASLKEKLSLEGTFSRHNGAYYFETPEGCEAPFCSRCWDTNARLIRLRTGPDGVAACPQCSGR